MAVPALAQTRPFEIGGATVQLEPAPETAGAFLRAFRPNRATGRWEVDVIVTNGSARILKGPIVLRFDVARDIAPGISGTRLDSTGQPYLDLGALVPGGGFAPGTALPMFTLSLGDGRTRPALLPVVYSQPEATGAGVVLLRTLDADGVPLEGVSVTDLGSETPRTLRSGREGWISLEVVAGVRGWEISRPGYLPVLRPVPDGLGGNIQELPSVRLVAPAASGPTPLGPQSLPARLPRGWSPLGAALLPVGAGRIDLGEALPLGTAAVLVRWDPGAGGWRTERLLTGDGGASVEVAGATEGILAIVRADTAPVMPVAAVPGELLGGVGVVVGNGVLRATGRVEPASRPASTDPGRVTADAVVDLVSDAGPLTSGLTVPAEITQEYRLRDGTRRVLPAYGMTLTAYRHPVGAEAGGLGARFRLRPVQLLPGEELVEAIVRVRVFAPAGFAGTRIGPGGGAVEQDGLRLVAGADVFPGETAVAMRRLNTPDFADAVPAGLQAIAGFELGSVGTLPGTRFGLSIGPVAPGSDWVLARLIYDSGRHGLQPVERYRGDAAGGLVPSEPAQGERLAGIDGGGQYWLFGVGGPQSLVLGKVTGSDGAAVAGAGVRSGPWTAFTDPDGRYRLVSPAGTARVDVSVPGSGDTGSATAEVPGPSGIATVDVATARRGPQVVRVTPGDGAGLVPRVTSVTVTFSKPVNPGTVAAGGVVLLGANGQPVATSASLNLAGTTVTLLPGASLAGAVEHEVVVAPTVTDAGGLPVEGQVRFRFTTESDVLLRVAGEVTSQEPTNGVAAMVGSPGTAEPEAPVILVNETTGVTATVLSKVDGSFSNSIPADVDDFLAAILVNRNGTQSGIPVSKQFFRDGSVALFNGGGILEAEGDGGPVQVIVEPGAIDLKTKFKLTPIPFGLLTNELGTLPATARLLGGMMFTQEGEDLKVGADLSFPIDVAALGLTNAPQNCTWALATPREVDGEVVYEIIDQMHYENGRLVTHSPPFVGALLKEVQKRFKQALKSDKLNRRLAKLIEPPEVRPAFYRIALLPLLIAQGHSLIVLGDTYSAEFDDQNVEIPGSRRMVAGAAVALAYEDFQDQPGRLQPGATFTVSGSDGKYSILFPINRLKENGFIVRGTHPAFPFQRVAVPVSIPSIAQQVNAVLGPVLGPNAGLIEAINSINNALTMLTPKVPAHIGFRRFSPVDATADDAGPPLLALSVSPQEPAPGTNSADGAVVVVSAIDDTQVSNVTLSVLDWETVNPDITNNLVILTPVAGARLTQGVGSIQDAWRIQSLFRANIRVRATGTDAQGNESEAVTLVQVLGDRQLPPRGTNDTTGPRILASFPLQNARGVRPGTPVLIQFSEPLAATNMANVPRWLTISGAATLASSALSGDGRQLTVYLAPNAEDPNQAVSITVGGQVVDLAGNVFDQDPVTTGSQSYTLQFQIITGESRDLAGLASGGGVVQKGAYAYALERTGSLDGSVVVYNLQSNQPVRLAELSVPGYPRDLALIPSYAFKLKASDPTPRTNDLLAVVGGVTGSETLQYLWILDIGDPANPVRLAGANITFGVTATTKLVWSAPFLAYLDSGADITSVSLVDLQTFLIGNLASREEIAAFPVDFVPGVDANNDGDYVDPGDSLPSPERNPVDYFGKLLSVVDGLGDRRIEDFDLDANRGLVGMVMRGGHAYGQNGLPDPSATLPPAYRTAFAGMQALEPTNATFNLPVGSFPRRVALFPQVRLEGTNSLFRDLAVISLAYPSGGSNNLVVLDITDPNKPGKIGEVELAGYGQPQSLRRREDGLLAVATMGDVLLLDPAKLALAPGAGSIHPAIIGIVPGAGSGVRSYVAATAGINLVNAGGNHRVTYTAPGIRFLVFPEGAVQGVAALSNAPSAVLDSVFRGAQYPGVLQKTRLFNPSVGTNPPVLAPVDPRTLYYLRVDALGTLGVTNGGLELVLESLNNAGRPLPAPNGAGLPVRLAPTNTLVAVGDTNWMATNASPYARTLRAQRLSSDPRSTYYNVFLAGPFVLSDVPLKSNEVRQVSAQLPRAVLRSGRFLWAGLDGTNGAAAYPSNILSSVAGRRLVPGTLAVAGVSHVPRPVIFIPGIAGSYLDETNSTSSVNQALNERWLGFALDSNHQKLSLTGGAGDGIAPTDAVRYVIRQAQFFPIYGPFLQYLTNELSFVEYDYRKGSHKDWARYRTVADALREQMPNQPDLFVFPYDWRRDNATSASNLVEYVRLVKLFHPEMEKIDIIAHSMGGLVARRYILDHPGQVEKCISIATPWFGAPKAIAALQTGDFDSLVMNALVKPETLRGLSEDFPGFHQLLPSRAYFDAGGQPLTEFNWDIDGDGTVAEALDYDSYKRVVDTVLGTSSGSHPVAAGEVFHDHATPLGAMDDWRGDSTGVEHSVIYGVQKVPRTIGRVRTAFRLAPVTPECSDIILDLPWKPESDKGQDAVEGGRCSRVRSGSCSSAGSSTSGWRGTAPCQR